MKSSECINYGNCNNNNQYKNCIDPLTSVGIICIKLEKKIYNKFKNNLQFVSYYNLNNFIMEHIDKFNEFFSDLKIKYILSF
jgi:hypothetical protein